MKACIKCGSGYAIGFGKAHSPRKSAGRSASNAPAWVVTAPLSGGVNISSDQQVMSGRAARGPIGNALPQLRDGEVTGGPPGGGIGSGGGTGGGGDGHGSGGGASPGPGPQWWLFCIQAAAAGWAAGCVVFEAGHILHRPAPAALSLPASAKMGLARKSVVQMQHDHFNMPWIWVLLAALGSIAVVLSKRREDPETELFRVEEERGEDEACEPAPVASEEHSYPDVDTLASELQDASARSLPAASNDHADRDAVPSLDPELQNARTSVFSAATARAESAPLPDLQVLTCPDNASFHELQRFWASGGTVSPRSPDCGARPMQPCAEVLRPSHKRPASLDLQQNPLAAGAQAGAATWPGSSFPKPACDVRLPSSRSHHDSDAMSWPSTPHTPDLKGGGGVSSDLAAAGVDVPVARELVKGAHEADGLGAGAERHGERSSEPENDTGVSKPRQTLPRQEFRNGSSAESRAVTVADDADQVDEASTEVATMDRFEEMSHVPASQASHCDISPSTDVVDASVAEDRQEAEPQRAASSIGSQGPSSPTRSRVATDDIDAGADEDDSLCSSPRGNHAEGEWLPTTAEPEPHVTLASGNTEEGTASTASVPSSPASGSAVSSHGVADAAEDEAPGADMGACSAFSLPQSDKHVQVHSTLNLRSLTHAAVGPIPKPIAVPDALSESAEAASPRQAPLTERSCVKGGLDTTSSTVFPQNSWQIADDVEVEVGRSSGPQVPVASCTSDGDVDSPGMLSPQPLSAWGHASDESFGSSGSPSFMSFPSEQNQVGVFQWN